MTEWNQTKIQQYIDNRIEESTTLDYKDGRALDKIPGKKKEIAKDVSAMANTAGGIIIYGVSEHRHLPEKITPIDRTQFPREWLDQVITHNIRPLIERLTIHPVEVGTAPNNVVYVVEVPQSMTAHQVTAGNDYRYYERSNFISVPMEDYRIRDVMNRATLPDAEVEFHLTREFSNANPPYDVHILRATVINTGLQAINHFKLRFVFPYIGLELNSTSSADFLFRDVYNEGGFIEHHLVIYRSREVLFPEDEILIGPRGTNPCCFSYAIDYDQHEEWIEARRRSKSSLSWVLFADDMPPKRGEIPFHRLYG